MATQITTGPGSGGTGTSKTTLALNFTFDEGTSGVVNFELRNANSNVQISAYDLSSGDNTITAPTNPVPSGAMIIPPTTNTNAITLKGAAGDTGVSLDPAAPSHISFPDAGVSDFILNAGGTISDLKIAWT